jgi:restriction system protein
VDVGVLLRQPLVLQAVVIPGPKTHEGNLIEAVAPAWFEIARAIQRDPAFMHRIDHRKWEELIAAAYKQAGFDEVTLTPRSGDLGRDVIAVKRGFVTVRILDEVKAYGPGHLVSAEVVRALGFVLDRDPAATHGIVTTTSDFAPRIEEDDYIKPLLDLNQA